MDKNARIFVAGHRGLVGSALVRQLRGQGYGNLLTRTHAELDLTDAVRVADFFAATRPEHVILAAAKVGGILANKTYPADFIRINLAIQLNVIHNAFLVGVKRLLFLGSSCIYPRLAPQPMREEHLLTGPLEPTNRPYALAKISGIELCWSYNRQHATHYLAVMPTNLYGPGDNYHPQDSHVIPALIRKFHEARARGDEQVTLWGSGAPRREFLYSDDMAQACLHLLNLPDADYVALLGEDDTRTGNFAPPLVNIGQGDDVTIRELALLVAKTVGFEGGIAFDPAMPDGSPQKLLDVTRLRRTGWRASIGLEEGLAMAYADFLSRRGEALAPAR